VVYFECAKEKEEKLRLERRICMLETKKTVRNIAPDCFFRQLYTWCPNTLIF